MLPLHYEQLAEAAKVHIVDLGDVLLAPFSAKAHAYAAKRMEKDGVALHLGVGVKEVHADHVVLSDGSTIKTHTVIWGGGRRPPT